MAFSPELRDHILELLEPLGPVTARPMFGGVGFFFEGAMFALLTRADVLYLRTDDETRGAFQDAGMDPFRPASRQVLRPALSRGPARGHGGP